ncbi:protein MpaA [Nocardioides zeae]|uniref:Protein MpaA n=1 Tax=Nocardioides zeae TaxID=1457234 RepID=A0ACC6IEL7_9ACTN|nr:DUF2817 domain-containing protein [Nocardioides zeae]MDR6174980.1 protein MpaA [Nocardioides zeae]MDR6209210.1 protein MpaA [Nocardioides zeae]
MKPPRCSRVPFLSLLVGLLAVALLVGSPVAQAEPRVVALPPALDAAAAPAAKPYTQSAKWVYGRTAQGRDLVAYRVGNYDATFTAMVVVGMHGNEQGVNGIATGLRELAAAGRFTAVDLWIVPAYNPDGLVAKRRQNSRGVDLNRNFPHNWRRLSGNYHSGNQAASEVETHSFMKVLDRVQPDLLLSFHQPLNGVDIDTKYPSWSRYVAEGLNLPLKNFNCGGVCSGTMTGWYNARYPGIAMTVEYGARPDATYMRTYAPRRVAALFQRAGGAS